MPAYTPVRFFTGQPSNAETTQYTVPGATSAILKEVNVANVTGGAVNFEMSLVPSGGAAGAANRLIPTVSIPANTVVTFTFYEVMNTGDFISTLAGASTSLTVKMSGVTFV
jgi:hypothetical protein